MLSNFKTIDDTGILLTMPLLEKYSVNIPRYTSYPPAPEWKERFTENDWYTANQKANENKTPVSLYFHLPFCESRCYFCACNVVISKKKEITKLYLEQLKKEITNLGRYIDGSREVRQIHLGGGTPTFFSPPELEDLFNTVKNCFNISKNCETSVEIDPRVTTQKHLQTFSRLGFNRLSMGVQDFNLKVQQNINRIQSFELTKSILDQSREYGFSSINIDLIYGLPFQTLSTFSETVDLVFRLNPDRIALFHYAHLPQILKHQNKYISDSALPSSKEKIKIFQYVISKLINNGYVYIGLDHFAKPNDELAIARQNKSLYRNFQGYTTKAGCDLYGFGITAISSIQNTFMQNIKKLNPYYEAIKQNKIPIERGIILSNDDSIRKEIIMRILCHGEINIAEIEKRFGINFKNYFSYELEKLKEFEKDNLLLYNSIIKVTAPGQFFLRNIASVFDYYLQKTNGKQRIYSKSI